MPIERDCVCEEMHATIPYSSSWQPKLLFLKSTNTREVGYCSGLTDESDCKDPCSEFSEVFGVFETDQSFTSTLSIYSNCILGCFISFLKYRDRALGVVNFERS